MDPREDATPAICGSDDGSDGGADGGAGFRGQLV